MLSLILFKMTTASASFLLFNTVFEMTITSFLLSNKDLRGKPSRRKKETPGVWDEGGQQGERGLRVRGIPGSSYVAFDFQDLII